MLMLVGDCKILINMTLYVSAPDWIREIPHLKTQKMCGEAVCIEPYSLEFVSNRFITQEMCDKLVCIKLCPLEFVSNNFKTKEMCEKAVYIEPCSLQFVPHQVKIKRCVTKQ